MFDSNQNSQDKRSFLDSTNEKNSNSANGYSRTVRRKLYFLFAMLILVIVLMKEAKKPEHWMWMGFERDGSAISSAIELDATPQELQDSELDSDSAISSISSSTQSLESTNETSFNAARDSFWKELWEELETEDQTALVQLVQVSQRPLEARKIETADFELLVEEIEKAPINDNDPFAPQWQGTLKPALLALARGDDVTINQQVAIGKLFESLDSLILAGLDDFTSPGRKTDTPAWHRFWRHILEQPIEQDSESVSPVQLVSQPDAWRFKPVRLTGRLMSGRSRPSGMYGPLRDQDQWYEWWIGNAHGADEVWCVYTATKPDSLEVGDKFSNFDVPISVSGYFYKVRAYVDTQSQANHCPLVLANSLLVTQRSNPIAAASWKPSTSVLIASIAGVLILAFAVAMLIYRSDQKSVRHPGGEHKAAIAEHLDSLSDDPNIKSMNQRLEDLS